MSDDGEKKGVTIAQEVRGLRENMLALIEFTQLRARLARVKYLALIKEGFTPEQAPRLCKE